MWRPALTLAVALVSVIGLYITICDSGLGGTPAPDQNLAGPNMYQNVASKMGVFGRVVKVALNEFNICPKIRKAVLKAEEHIEKDILSVLDEGQECAENTQTRKCLHVMGDKVRAVLMKEMELTMSKEEDDDTSKLKKLFVRLAAFMATPFIKKLQKELPAKPEEAVEVLGSKIENKLSVELDKFCPSPEDEQKWEDISGLEDILEKDEVSDDMKATLTRLWLHHEHAHHQERAMKDALVQLSQNTVTREQLSETQAYSFGNHIAHEKLSFIMLWCAFFGLAALFAIDKARQHRSGHMQADGDSDSENHNMPRIDNRGIEIFSRSLEAHLDSLAPAEYEEVNEARQGLVSRV